MAVATRPQRLSTSVADALREEILKGIITPGCWLRQEELAERFGVSRMPIRQAMRQLAAEGLVDLDRQWGGQVTQLAVEEIEELFEMRALLEGAAVAQAVRLVTSGDVSRMKSELDLMRASTDTDAFLQHNARFHGVLLEISGRKHMRYAVDRIRVNVERYLRVYIWLIGQLAQRNDDHREILDAVTARDAAKARKLTERHIRQTGELVAKALRHAQGHVMHAL
ncbi:MAG: GntR family transcriptional regulator [Rhizobiaceae bacterium]|nr:MAG: GntR family transcriptional regulator [Rhizobiaceae bacterium]